MFLALQSSFLSPGCLQVLHTPLPQWAPLQGFLLESRATRLVPPLSSSIGESYARLSSSTFEGYVGEFGMGCIILRLNQAHATCVRTTCIQMLNIFTLGTLIISALVKPESQFLVGRMLWMMINITSLSCELKIAQVVIFNSPSATVSRLTVAQEQFLLDLYLKWERNTLSVSHRADNFIIRTSIGEHHVFDYANESQHSSIFLQNFVVIVSMF